MFAWLLKHTKSFVITLRLSILSIFVLMFILTMITILSVFYFHLYHVVMQAALFLMQETSSTILYDLDNELRPAEEASKLSANNIREHVFNVNDEPQAATYMVHLLKRLPLASGAYWGDIPVANHF